MLARIKTDAEPMTKSFHNKISLLEKCYIKGEEALLCIIKGLPIELRANAKEFQCEAPQQLYYGYLSSFESIQKIAESWRRSTYGRSYRK